MEFLKKGSMWLARVTCPETGEQGMVETTSAPTRADAERMVADAERARLVERRGYYTALFFAVMLFGALVAKSRQLELSRKRGAA